MSQIVCEDGVLGNRRESGPDRIGERESVGQNPCFLAVVPNCNCHTVTIILTNNTVILITFLSPAPANAE